MSNYHNTLNDALNSVGLIELWPLGSNINYGQTVQHIVETRKGHKLISVYRDERGLYETPVHYFTN